MQISRFALIAQNYAVRVSDFVRQSSFALNSLASARETTASHARVFLGQIPLAAVLQTVLVLHRVRDQR